MWLKVFLLLGGVILSLSSSLTEGSNFQFWFFALGIATIGIPHGAADLLVAKQNANKSKLGFTSTGFIINYLVRLTLFGAVFKFFPLIGIGVFFLFAAYHFGQTDLFQIEDQSVLSKFLVLCYGLLILSIIILVHLGEVKPLYDLFDKFHRYILAWQWITTYRYNILLAVGISFFVSGFCFLIALKKELIHVESFLVQFLVIVFSLSFMPLLVGFTFYFVFWHSILSLNNILNYLMSDSSLKLPYILGQMALYSTIAFIGISLFAFLTRSSLDSKMLISTVFVGLAVLTAPHMQVMNTMYKYTSRW